MYNKLLMKSCLNIYFYELNNYYIFHPFFKKNLINTNNTL